MIIAVTYDQGQVWQHFGKTENFKFYTVEDGKICSSEVVNTQGQGHGALADFLHIHHANIIICGGVGVPMIDRLAAYGIKAVPGITGSADEAVQKYLDGTLSGNASAVHEGFHHHDA